MAAAATVSPTNLEHGVSTVAGNPIQHLSGQMNQLQLSSSQYLTSPVHSSFPQPSWQVLHQAGQGQAAAHPHYMVEVSMHNGIAILMNIARGTRRASLWLTAIEQVTTTTSNLALGVEGWAPGEGRIQRYAGMVRRSAFFVNRLAAIGNHWASSVDHYTSRVVDFLENVAIVVEPALVVLEWGWGRLAWSRR